jgi:hypothetical protein
MIKLISVVGGDLDKAYWEFRKLKMSTPGTIWMKSVNLKKELVRVQVLVGPEAERLKEEANLGDSYAAAGGVMGGLVGMLVGHAVGKNAIAKNEQVCFKAFLRDGRAFFAVAFRDAFEEIISVPGITLDDEAK